MTFQNIPGELKSLPQWVVWRAEPRDGKISKVPYRLDGRRASSTNPDDWTTFDRTVSAVSRFSGIGFVFRAGGGIVGIDLDHVIDAGGNIEPWVMRTVEAFGSYTEISVSGTGLHIICEGAIPDGKGHRRNQVEMYDRGRYFTVTGNAYGEPLPLRDAQPVINRLLEWMKREEPKPQNRASRVSPCPDRKLLHHAASAKNGYKFARLWQGDTADYGGDDSRADIALLSMLMFWTRGDEPRADALFRQSGLNRPKWERREDYRRRCFDFLAGGN
jgi:primase-polymerase (primpol)-like protein